MLAKIKDAIIGDIWSDTYQTLADGGPTCYSELSDLYRLSVTIISVRLSDISDSFYMNVFYLIMGLICMEEVSYLIMWDSYVWRRCPI